LYYELIYENVTGGYENKGIIFDCANKKAKLIQANSNLVFVGDDYFFIKRDKSNVYLYKNDTKIFTIPLEVPEHLSDYVVSSDNKYFINKVADKGFYVNIYAGYANYNSYIIYWEGRIKVVEIKEMEKYYMEPPYRSDDSVLILNASNGSDCYVFTPHRFGEKFDYTCFYYSRNFKSLILTKYFKRKNVTKFFIEKFNKTFYIKGQVNLSDVYIGYEDGLLYLIVSEYSTTPYRKKLLIPLINKDSVTIPLPYNIIAPDEGYIIYNENYYGSLTSNKIYILPKIPLSIRKKVSKLLNLCKYRKNLCR
jgi:hypothetical protein